MLKRKRVLSIFSVIMIFSLITTATGCNAPSIKNSKVIHYSSMWKEGEPQGTWLKKVAVDFEKATGIKVELKLEGREVLVKEKGNIIMKTPPDIIDQDINELSAALLNKEILAEPLDDLYHSKGPEGQAKLKDIFSQKLVNLYKKGGKSYFLPYEFITTLFICDKSTFEQNKLELPKTWEEFISSGQGLKEKGLTPLALDGNIYGYGAYYYCLMLERIMGPGNLLKAALDKSGACFDEPGYLKAARLISEMSKSQKNFFQKGYENSNYPQAQANWAKNGAVSIFCGTWIPVETVKLVGKSFKYGFYSFPEVSSGIGKATDLEAILIGGLIPKNAKNPEGAKEFLKFMINKKNALSFVRDTISISSRIDVEYPKLLADVKEITDGATNFIKPYDGLMADAPEWFANVFYPLDNQLLFGEISPEAFIKQLKKKSIEYHKENN
jgi:ABC-type glycerol-3-phosphate transport system substrate-binding protein